ncbi:MAG: phage portal protein, partial [Verrucomicrobiota bacterium]
RRWLEDGEAFVRFHVDRSHDVVPLRLEVIDADQLDTTVMSYQGNPVFLGIELDRQSWRPVAYWVYKYAGENPAYPSLYHSERVPADEIVHLYTRRYPYQLRGIPFMSAVAAQAWNIQDYADAQLLRNKLAACFSVLITGGEGGGGGLADDSYDETADKDSQSFPVDSNGNRIAHVAPGIIGKLPEGYEVHTVNPTSPESSYEPFLTSQIMAFGAGFEGGISYTGLTRDTSKTTFAGGRMAENMDSQGYRPLMRRFEHAFLRQVTHRWLDAAVLSGAVTAPGYEVDPRYWRRHKWMPAGWTRGINPSQEMDAAQKSLDMGITTLDDECASLGLDYQVQLAKRAKIAREKLQHIQAVRDAAKLFPDVTPADIDTVLGNGTNAKSAAGDTDDALLVGKGMVG